MNRIMKVFVKKTFYFTAIFFFIISAVFSYRIIRTKKISWELPASTHVLFMGASHILVGVNDSIYKGSLNIASSSERYLLTYLKLNNIVKINHHIDTVFLQFAPTDVWENTDSKYYSVNEMSHFLPLYFPFFQWMNGEFIKK